MPKRVIWKYPLTMLTRQEIIDVGENAIVRPVAEQNEKACVWIEHDEPEGIVENEVVIELVGTGNRIPQGGTYVGMLFWGSFVFSVYDVTRKPQTKTYDDQRDVSSADRRQGEL